MTDDRKLYEGHRIIQPYMYNSARAQPDEPDPPRSIDDLHYAEPWRVALQSIHRLRGLPAAGSGSTPHTTEEPPHP